MKRKSASSEISSGKNSEVSTEGFTIYDVPGAVLDARGVAYTLLSHPEAEVRATAQKIIDYLTRCVLAMGRDDVGVLVAVEDNKEVA